MNSSLSLPYDSGAPFEAYLAMPEEKTAPGLILIHEIWGLDDHMKDVSNRFAKAGYLVLAPDLFGDIGILKKMGPTIFADMQNPDKRHEAQAKMREVMEPIKTPEFAATTIKKLSACFDYLTNHAQSTKSVGVLGFCFGGTYSFHLATAEPRLKAAVAFYGQPPSLDKVKDIACPVMALYGEQDAGLMESLPALKEQMKKDGKDFTAIVYPNTGHAFFNNTNIRAYNKEAADDAWIKATDFLKKNLG